MSWPSFGSAFGGRLASVLWPERAQWRIYLRDENLERLAEIEDYQSLRMVSRHCAGGAWLLDLHGDSDVARSLGHGRGILVLRDGEPFFSGELTRFRETWGDRGRRLEASGVDDTALLARRIVYPDPAGDFTSQSHDVRTGPGETVLRGFVDDHAGPSAMEARRIPHLALATDEERGDEITGRGRLQNLLEFLQGLALAAGDLGFRIIQSDGQLLFEVYESADRTGSAIFSPALGNLRSYVYELQAPEANHVVVGAAGELEARLFDEASDASSIAEFGRYEGFRDRRDTGDAGEVTQSLAEELSRSAHKTRLEVGPIDTAAVSYFTDYGLGDTVTVVIGGVSFSEIVREVEITLDSKGETVVPLVATPGSIGPNNPVADLIRDIRTLRSRVNDLERR